MFQQDIFDFYYLINNESLSKDKLLKCFDTFIFSDETMKESNIFITKNQGTIWLKSDGNSIIIQKLKELNLDGANKVSYRSIFDICSYFFIKIS